MVSVTSLCQHSSGRLVLVNTVKVNHFGQLNNPIRPHTTNMPASCSSCEGRSQPQGEHSFGLVIWFCQLTKGQLWLGLRHSVQHGSGQIVLVNAIKVNPFGQLGNAIGVYRTNTPTLMFPVQRPTTPPR